MLKRALLALFCLLPALLQAQTSTVTGVVTSAKDHLPLPGVTVLIKNTTTGTLTDADGHFSLQVKDANATTLVIRFLSYEEQEVPIDTHAPLHIQLTAKATDINEVVVVAYGSAQKSTYTGSVSQIKKEQIATLQVSSVSKALQGQVPGLQSTSPSGQPGEDATIRIRGVGSINASSDPLYVVDGVPYGGSISAINPADIESVSVLKDASSSALYGSRGANGVIIITTKKGARNNRNSTIDLRVRRGASTRAVADYNTLGIDDYFQLYWEALRNAAVTNGLANPEQNASSTLVEKLGINPYGPQFPEPVGTDGKLVAGAKPLWNDNWQKATQRTGQRTEATININGGSETSSYYISGGYLNDQGMALNSGFKRYNVRTNLDLDAKKWLKIGINLNAAQSIQDAPPSEDSRTDNYILYGRLMPNFYPIYQHNPDGSLVLDASGHKILDYGDYRPSAANTSTNLVGTAYLDKHQEIRDDISARIYGEITLWKGLKFKTSYNADYINRNNNDYTNPDFGWDAPIGGTVSRDNHRTFSWTVNNIFTYDALFNNVHHLNLLAGQEAYEYQDREFYGNRQDFVKGGFYEPVAASQLLDFSGSAVGYALSSYLGRATYDYKQKYYLSGSLRTDGSSRFSPQERWGTFWSVGASWQIYKEPFLRNVRWLNLLALKASYGAQGNDNLGTYYAYQGLYSIMNNLGNGGAYQTRLATNNLKWETNLNLNTGVEFYVLNNRLGGTVEYFRRRSKDLLYQQPLPLSTGFSFIDANIGALRNTGVELQLNTVPVQTKDFSWHLDLNYTHYKNEITELPQKEIISGTKKLMVGHSIYDFYLREWAGVDPATGKAQWYQVDASGKKTATTVYANATQVYEHSSLPDFYGGVTNTFRYKGFSLSALLVYSVGGKVLDNDELLLLHNGASTGRAWSSEMWNRWTPTHTHTDVPSVSTINNSWTSASSRFLYDATYARLKNVTLTYALPASLLHRFNVNGLSVYVQGDNLITWFGHQGMDPEQSVDGTTYYRYPAIKSVSAGLNLSF
jgi:TonB-linked SusC/RagA family outer membrane protein